jgi:hypothetical protein
MTIKELENEQSLLDKYIQFVSPKRSKYKKPILDGITDIEKYLNSEYKICWVLKEPYDEDDGYGGGFNLRNAVKKWVRAKNQHFVPTWKNIGMVSYSLLNRFIPFNKIKEMEVKDYIQSLLYIAFFNVGKMPAEGLTRTKHSILKKEYNNWKPILHWQLKTYDPDIVIFGGTWELFWKDLGITEKDDKYINAQHYILRNGKLFIDAYHPSQWSVKDQENYCNDIIKVVKKVMPMK